LKQQSEQVWQKDQYGFAVHYENVFLSYDMDLLLLRELQALLLLTDPLNQPQTEPEKVLWEELTSLLQLPKGTKPVRVENSRDCFVLTDEQLATSVVPSGLFSKLEQFFNEKKVQFKESKFFKDVFSGWQNAKMHWEERINDKDLNEKYLLMNSLVDEQVTKGEFMDATKHVLLCSTFWDIRLKRPEMKTALESILSKD
jgi:hypothetical protein